MSQATYRAAQCARLEGPGAIEIVDLPRPDLEPGAVRVAVAAAGVNFPDLLMTLGAYQHNPGLPFVPGLEAAGTVAEVAAGVDGLTVGQRVMVSARAGAFAEELVVPAGSATPTPAGLSDAEAACFQVGAMTAYHGLIQRGRLQAGETALILGATGGVGLAAVEVAKLSGATVIAAGTRAAKLDAVASKGADHVIDLSAQDLREAVLAATDGRGADVVYDPVGGDLFKTAMRCVAWNGRLLLIGFAAGTIPTAAMNHPLMKSYSIVGVHAGEATRRDPALLVDLWRGIGPWVAAGHLKPHISHRLGLDRAGEALAVLQNRQVTGRVVIEMAPS